MMEPLVTHVTLSRDHVSDADRRSRSSWPLGDEPPTGVGRQGNGHGNSATDFADEAGSACDGHLDGGNVQIHSGLKE